MENNKTPIKHDSPFFDGKYVFVQIAPDGRVNYYRTNGEFCIQITDTEAITGLAKRNLSPAQWDFEVR
jgi:hypothetical protein